MHEVKKHGKEHIIHGSFRGLDYLSISDAGALRECDIIEKKIGEMEGRTKTAGNEGDFSSLKGKEVAKIADGVRISESLLENCKSVRMLIIGDGCDIVSTKELVFDSVPNLERVEIGCECFKSVTAFHVHSCCKLRRLFIGNDSFAKCMSCVIEDNAELLELQLGGNEGVSISKPIDNKKKTSKGKCPTENNSAAEYSTEDTDKTLSDDSPDKKGSSEPTLKLASCFSPVECNE